jgi:hypothetical protein
MNEQSSMDTVRWNILAAAGLGIGLPIGGGSALGSETFPPPKSLKHGESRGENIQRTMRLLATSTPASKHRQDSILRPGDYRAELVAVGSRRRSAKILLVVANRFRNRRLQFEQDHQTVVSLGAAPTQIEVLQGHVAISKLLHRGDVRVTPLGALGNPIADPTIVRSTVGSRSPSASRWRCGIYWKPSTREMVHVGIVGS